MQSVFATAWLRGGSFRRWLWAIIIGTGREVPGRRVWNAVQTNQWRRRRRGFKPAPAPGRFFEPPSEIGSSVSNDREGGAEWEQWAWPDFIARRGAGFDSAP